MFSKYELLYLIKILDYYEGGLVRIIEYYINTYTFNTYKELKFVVNLWCGYYNYHTQTFIIKTKDCINNYGHFSYLNVSKITSMSMLFMRSIFECT